MAISPKLLKQKLSKANIAELEREYAKIKAHYYYDSKEAQIKATLDNRLNASYETNMRSRRIALEELLEERTGQRYELEERFFDIKASDVSDYLAAGDKALASLFTDFFAVLQEPESKKLNFILDLALSKENYEQFISELRSGAEAEKLYAKYIEIAQEFRRHNSRKG